MLKICSFFSGSSGNCTYIESENAAILVDAGVSMKKIFEKLSEINRRPDFVKAIFVTHEHSDHILSVGSIARKLSIPVYATKDTWRAMYKSIGKLEKDFIKPVEPGEEIQIEDICITAFKIPHDAADPVGYKFESGGRKFAIATDIGEMNENIFLAISGCSCVLLESNHDVDMLLKGNYPYNLKQRIRGKCGHLSNEEAAITCSRLVSVGTRKILLGHLSEENNRPEIAFQAAKDCILKCGVKVPEDVFLDVAGLGAGELIEI